MRFGIIGLGRIGAGLARRAREAGHQIVGYDRDEEARWKLEQEGCAIAPTIHDLAAELCPSRIVLLYAPAGAPTDETCRALRPALAAGDIVVDGGNSHWLDSRRRQTFLAQAGIRFLDVGTSGGVSGARHGACFMVGGEREAYDRVQPLLRDLAADEQAVFYAGGAGAGHFAKLVHNAIEFAMVQAIAEGVELLMRSDYEFDLPGLFSNWAHGSVIRSWLVELMRDALRQSPDFGPLSTYVEDTGEVKWALAWELEHDVPTQAISAAQTELMRDRDVESPTAKAVALLRNQYGSHPVHRTVASRMPSPRRRTA